MVILLYSVINHAVLVDGVTGAIWTEATTCGDVPLPSRQSQTEDRVAVQPHLEMPWKLPENG